MDELTDQIKICVWSNGLLISLIDSPRASADADADADADVDADVDTAIKLKSFHSRLIGTDKNCLTDLSWN